MDGTTTTPATPSTRAWDRMPEERTADYSAFMAYLQLPPPRSARALAVATGLAERSLDRHRTKFRWVERAEAYDSWRLQEAITKADTDTTNPYQRMLMQSAARAMNLHDAAERLLMQAQRRLDWSERQYQDAVKKDANTEPPMPNPQLVSCIRGTAEVMDKCAEAAALSLGISDVLKMQTEVGA